MENSQASRMSKHSKKTEGGDSALGVKANTKGGDIQPNEYGVLTDCKHFYPYHILRNSCDFL